MKERLAEKSPTDAKPPLEGVSLPTGRPLRQKGFRSVRMRSSPTSRTGVRSKCGSTIAVISNMAARSTFRRERQAK